MSKTLNNMNMGDVEPQDRMKRLSSYGNQIEVDKNQPVTR